MSKEQKTESPKNNPYHNLGYDGENTKNSDGGVSNLFTSLTLSIPDEDLGEITKLCEKVKIDENKYSGGFLFDPDLGISNLSANFIPKFNLGASRCISDDFVFHQTDGTPLVGLRAYNYMNSAIKNNFKLTDMQLIDLYPKLVKPIPKNVKSPIKGNSSKAHRFDPFLHVPHFGDISDFEEDESRDTENRKIIYESPVKTTVIRKRRSIKEQNLHVKNLCRNRNNSLSISKNSRELKFHKKRSDFLSGLE